MTMSNGVKFESPLEGLGEEMVDGRYERLQQ